MPTNRYLDNRIYSRESNFELLRIVAMSMVLLIHFFWLGGPMSAMEGYGIARTFFAYGVDIFILISGWFSIRLSWKSVLRLWLYLLFFNLVMLGAYAAATGGDSPQTTADNIATVLASFSSSKLWFLELYFLLMFLAPLFNRAVNGMSLHNLRIAALALTFLEFYSCFLFENLANNYGFQLFNFIYLYLIGRYLRREPMIAKVTAKPLIIMILSAIVVFLIIDFVYYKNLTLLRDVYVLKHINDYSSPKVVLIAVAFVLLFSKWHFHSKAVNNIAAASLGCYILQDGILSKTFYDIQTAEFMAQPLHSWHWRWGLMCAAFYFGFWIASYVLTRIANLFIPRLTARIISLLPSWLKPEED